MPEGDLAISITSRRTATADATAAAAAQLRGTAGITTWAIPSSIREVRRRAPAVAVQGVTCSRPRKV